MLQYYSWAVVSIFLILTLTTTFSNGQYETPKHICGGWFKSVKGNIQFKYNANTTGNDHVCAWTVSGSLANQYLRYDISIQQISGYSCNSTTTRVAVSHFNVYSQDVTAVETWSCGAPQTWRAVPGTVFIVVWKTTRLQNMTGFQLDWEPNGEILARGGVRTTAYSWGKSSVDPLPYYASGFFSEEVATHVFPKGNDTNGYALEIEFDNIELTQCGDEEADSGPCEGYNNSSLLILTIEEDARLVFADKYTDKKVENVGPYSSEWGLVILVWAGNFWRAGGRFQMVYNTILL